MKLLILEPKTRSALIRERRRVGADRQDEVWNGVYVMSPNPNNEHQELVGNLTTCLVLAIQYTGLGKVLPGGNVSDQDTDWKQNYRCPDVLVFLKGNKVEDRRSHWFGGPDLAIEIVSRLDRSRKKFAFYAKVGTRELLIVDRYPWALELYCLNTNGSFDLVGKSTLDQPIILPSTVVPLTFQLQSGDERPTIAIKHIDPVQTWSA